MVQDQRFGKGELQPRGKARAAPFQPFDMHVAADLHSPIVHRGAELTGAEHPGLHDGGEVLPLARAEHQRVDRQFADIVSTSSGPSGKFTTMGAIKPIDRPKICSVTQAGEMYVRYSVPGAMSMAPITREQLSNR